MRKKLCILPFFLLILVIFVNQVSVLAVDNNVSNITSIPNNVILLIDKSGSMNGTDGNHLAKSAACQFIDQLCYSNSDTTAITNVGVMAFSQKTELLSAPLTLDSDVNASYLKSEINKIKYNKSGTGGTDLGTAFYDATITLQKHSKDNSNNIIVLFTDGYSDNVLDESVSNENLNKAFGISSELGAQVFVVGLNHNNAITDAGKQEIYNIADTAQYEDGIANPDKNDNYAKFDKINYLVTDNIDDVREFYISIYARMVNGTPEPLDNYQFAVTTGGIIEADVTVYSESKIKGVKLIAPTGKEVKEDGKNYSVSGDDYYKVMKIANPEKGTWKIEVSSTGKDPKAYVVKFYGIEAAMNATWGTKEDFAKNKLEYNNVGKVEITPMYKSEPYTDDALMKSFTTKEFTATKGDGSSSNTYQLEYDSEAKKLVGYFPVENGEYNITSIIANEEVYREVTCDLVVNIVGAAESKYNLGTIGLKPNKDVEINLQEKFDIKNLRITSVDIDDKFVSSEYSGNVITLTGKNEGKGNIVIKVKDFENKEYTVTGVFLVEKGFTWYYIFVSVVVLALVLVAVAFIKNKLLHVPGTFKVSIEDTQNGTWVFSGEKIISYPRGKSFSVWNLIEYILNVYKVYDNLPENKKDMCEQIKRDRQYIESKNIAIYNENGNKKKKNYRLVDEKGDFYDIVKSGAFVYDSEKFPQNNTHFRIKIKFDKLDYTVKNNFFNDSKRLD